MAVSFALHRQTNLAFTQEPAQKRLGLSLVDRITEVDLITSTLDALDDEAITAELRGELSRELIAAIHGTREKIDRTAAVLAAFEAAGEAADAEIVRLAARKKYFARQHDRLADHVLAVLSGLNLKKLDGHTATLAARLNPASVQIDCEAAVRRCCCGLPPHSDRSPGALLIDRG